MHLQDTIVWAMLLIGTVISFRPELPITFVVIALAIMFSISAVASLILKEANWWLPLAVMNGRGISRLTLWKWRATKYYGWWLMALTCLLATILFPTWLTPILALWMQLASLPWLIKRWPGDDGPTWRPLINWLFMAVWMLLR